MQMAGKGNKGESINLSSSQFFSSHSLTLIHSFRLTEDLLLTLASLIVPMIDNHVGDSCSELFVSDIEVLLFVKLICFPGKAQISVAIVLIGEHV